MKGNLYYREATAWEQLGRKTVIVQWILDVISILLFYFFLYLLIYTDHITLYCLKFLLLKSVYMFFI